MSVLVDSSVWSLALRRRQFSEHPAVRELRELIGETRAHLVGAVRQEILSGIREVSQFERLRDRLREFPDLPVTMADHERAAELFNTCRSRGVQGSNTDFLLCAVAERYGMPILTTDEDFPLFARHVPIELHPVRDRASSE